MNFLSILQNFQNASNGTDAFKQLKQQCAQSIQNNPNLVEHTALFLIYGFAKNYVLLYEDQAITPEFATQEKQRLLGYMAVLSQALETQDSHLILSCLNQIVYTYNTTSPQF